MESFDLLIIGGGINGTAIARDAAARGHKVLLVEKDDLAAHTSSSSSKLIHGGLRYLEYYEFRLVREALREREILLRTAPHIVRPLRFVLPHGAGMRPWWMVRAGLGLYDLLAFGSTLPRSRSTDDEQLRKPLLNGSATRLATYWDAWVDDSRLVILNAVDAAERGAEIATRTEFLSASRKSGAWRVKLSGKRTITAAAIVNAAGPWVASVLQKRLRESSAAHVRLVKGSHIVVPKLFEGDHGYILQQPDGRVVFALPYGEATLVGTTDVPVDTPEEAVIGAEEIDYLCAAVNLYFGRQTAAEEVIWSYSGVRSLYDDGAKDAKAVTRDYHLELDDDPGPKLLSVFGGKITTARALAEEALDRLELGGDKITSNSPLPGGDQSDDPTPLEKIGSWLPAPLLARLSRSYGSRLREMLEGCESEADLGWHFGAGLYEAEVRYLMAHEFARTVDDILWRRTKLGLQISAAGRDSLAAWIETHGPS